MLTLTLVLVLALVLVLVEGAAARWRRGTSSGRRTSGGVGSVSRASSSFFAERCLMLVYKLWLQDYCTHTVIRCR